MNPGGEEIFGCGEGFLEDGATRQDSGISTFAQTLPAVRVKWLLFGQNGLSFFSDAKVSGSGLAKSAAEDLAEFRGVGGS